MNWIKRSLHRLWNGFKKISGHPSTVLTLRTLSFLAIVTVGIPMAWSHIPQEYMPPSFWDFFNSILLCYIAWNITIKKVGCWIKG